jgi:hypothetical protein
VDGVHTFGPYDLDVDSTAGVGTDLVDRILRPLMGNVGGVGLVVLDGVQYPAQHEPAGHRRSERRRRLGAVPGLYELAIADAVCRRARGRGGTLSIRR